MYFKFDVVVVVVVVVVSAAAAVVLGIQSLTYDNLN